MRLYAAIVVGMTCLLLAGCRTETSTPDEDESAAVAVPEPFVSAEPDPAWEAPKEKLRKAPDVEGPTLDGGIFRLIEQRGHVVVVNFWATWCLPCRAEIPDLIALHREMSDRGLRLVGVSMDAEGAEVVRPFVEKMSIDYPIVLDDGSLAMAFGGVYGLPATFVVNADGLIARRYLGLVRMEELRPLLEELLGES